jgi:transcriptional regulator with XRE-family HTH domain
MTERDLQGILSANIKRYRTNRNLSQASLAEKLNISVNFLCNIENGNKWVSPRTLVKFATALDFEPYELFKPDGALPPDVPVILNKCLDETIVAVTQAINQVRGHYVPKPGTLPKD